MSIAAFFTIIYCMHWKKYIIASSLGIVFLIGTAYTLFEISKSRTFQFFGGLTSRVQTEQKIVALTFDDAPTEYSNEVLTTLKKNNTKATFYMIGSEIALHQKEAQAITNAGMELGNHSFSHERFYFKSQSYIDQEIQKTNELIRKTGYKKEITFRPPNGKKLLGLPYYLNKHNIKTITWDIEPDTYINQSLSSEKKADFIVNYTVENTKPGSIILLHPFCKSCVSDREAIEPIIKELKKKGYTFVTVSELLKFSSQ